MTETATCLWFDRDGEAAARFYTGLLPDSRITRIMRAPGDYPSGAEGDPLVIEFTLAGRPYMILNGGPGFPLTQAASLFVTCEDQAEVDRYWSALTADGGAEVACGWCRDRWSLSWQIVPRAMMDLLNDSDRGRAARAFTAMQDMVKLDIAALERAAAG